MRILALLTALICASSAYPTGLGPLPPQGRALDSSVWEKYSLQTLREIFPDREDNFDSFRFVFVEGKPSLAVLRDKEHVVLWATSGLIDALESPEEYAYLLAHEIAHLELGHKFNTTHGERMALKAEDPAQWFLLVDEEIEADRYAARHVPNGYCAGAAISRRTMLAPSEDIHPRKQQMANRRITILESLCSLSGKNDARKEKS